MKKRYSNYCRICGQADGHVQGCIASTDWGIGFPVPEVDENLKPISNNFDERVKPIGIGDINSTAKGSAARYNSDKPDLSLIPLCTLEDEARVWMYGKNKYAAWNWAKGMPWSAVMASLMRHLSAFQSGEDNDPESGLPHLAHISCNVRMLTLYSKTYKEGDDRPKEWLK
jgi:hypothetical protein